MGTPPTREGRYSPDPATSNYRSATTPKVTVESFDMQIGDRFWCQAQVESATNQTVVTPSVSGGAIAWSLDARIPDSSNSNVSALWGWSGICTTAASAVTITLARPTSQTTLWWGFSVTHVRGSSGIGVIWDDNNGTGAGVPLSTQTVSANSLVIFNVNDWNALDGASRSLRMGATESNYFTDPARHTVYGAYTLNTSAGAYDAGLTAPSGMRWGLIGIEFLGTEDTNPVRALQENGAGILLENGTPLLF